MADPRIAVQIAAVDGFSATLTKFRRELTTTSGAIRAMKVADLPAPDANFERAGQQVLRFERTATQAATALRGLPGLGALGGIGSIAGIAAMAQNFATGNVSLRATAQMAGTTASGLNGLRGAAVLTGVSANTADQAMLGLNRTLGEAAFGRNMQAANVMRNLGIDFGSAATGARRASDVFPEVVSQVQRLAQTDPRAAARLLDILGMPGDILPLAMRGAEGIAELTRQAERLRPVTDANGKAADGYTLAMGRLELGATGLRDKLVTDLEPALSSVMGRMTDLIGRNKEAEASFGSLAKSALDAIRQAGIESGAADFAAKTGLTAFARQHVPWMGREYPDEAPSEARWRNRSPATRRSEDDPDWRPDVYDQLNSTGQFLYRNMPGSRGNYNATTQTGPSRYYGYASPGENIRAGRSPTAGPAVRTFDTTMTPQARGLLDTIAGTESPGYNIMYGGRRFTDMSQHPNVAVPIGSGPNAGQASTAAGRYQFLKSTWDEAAAATGAKDFSPGSQDRAAYWLAQRDYAQRTGRELAKDLQSTDPAVRSGIGPALRGTWTSLPGGIEAGTTASRFMQQLDANTKRNAATDTPAEQPDLSRGGRLPNAPTPTVPTPAASPEEPDLTRGGRLPSLAAPEAPRPAAVSDQSGSTVRIQIDHTNVPDGVAMRAGVEGSGAEIDRLNIRRAMPSAGH